MGKRDSEARARENREREAGEERAGNERGKNPSVFLSQVVVISYDT